MTMTSQDLATLNQVAIETYTRNLDLYLAKPARLNALYGSHFLDESIRRQAQVICDTASTLIGLPAVLVLILPDKYVVAATSEHAPLAFPGEVVEGPISVSMCRFTVNERKPFKVESATTHALVCYTESVTGDFGVRAYLGVPIIVRGEAIGALCVWGTVERSFSTLDVEVLVNLAAVLVALEAQAAHA